MKQAKNSILLKLFLSLIVVSMVIGISTISVNAAAPSGIKGNGEGGIYIDINAAPYTTFANKSYGQYAYGTQGCAWFASARYTQITGRDCEIGAGTAWYNSRAAKLGYARGSECRAKALACYGNHVSVIEKVSGNMALVSEGGSSGYSDANHGYCVIHWVSISDVKKDGNKRGNFLGFVYLDPYNSPNMTFDSAGQEGEGMVKVTGWAYDPDDINQQLAIHVYELRDGQAYFVGETIANTYRPDVNAVFGCGDYHGFEAVFPSVLGGDCNINVAAINIGSGENSWGREKSISISQDTQPPVISNVNVTDISNEGYTVTCNVSDNIAIKKIEFPTWTVAGGQDDIIWHAGTISDGVATCRINTSNHGNQINQDYVTHIYAWDYMGNAGSVGDNDYPCLYVNVRDTVDVKVIHYKEKLDGKYSKAEEVTYQGKPGEKITPDTKKYTGFIAPSKKTVTVKEDGSTVVKYYYTRNSYKLTWDLAGGKASGTYTKGTVKYGAAITAPTPKKTGYTFNGWDTEVPSKMPAKNLTIKATWKAKTNTKYTVEHYKQKVDGKYNATASESESFKGKTNASVTPEVKTYKGFTSPEVQTAKIKADGTLVIKYYYTRNSYKLTWDFAGGSAKGSYTSGKVKYGAKITAPVPTRDGYAFEGWDKTVSEKMPAKNVTYTATWRKLTQEELVEAFVERFYVIILDRPAESKGLNDWTNSLLSKKKTGADVAAGFINSQEFQSKKMSDEEYLNKLYSAFFDREPDKAGYDSWMRELKNGKSRDYVLGGFINSNEFNNLCKKYGIRTGGY